MLNYLTLYIKAKADRFIWECTRLSLVPCSSPSTHSVLLISTSLKALNTSLQAAVSQIRISSPSLSSTPYMCSQLSPLLKNRIDFSNLTCLKFNFHTCSASALHTIVNGMTVLPGAQVKIFELSLTLLCLSNPLFN